MSTPDVLGNRKTVQNIIIHPGPLTESHHIATLTTKAIIKETLTILFIKEAKQENFQQQVHRELSKIAMHGKIDNGGIDRKLDQWYIM